MKKYLFFFLSIILTLPIFSQEIIKLKDIKAGMMGYGLSVFRGSKIEKFHLEVIDTLYGFLPGEDIFLVKCNKSYTGYDLKKSGLIAGMSGSPIYIQNKLAGALAYGWPQAKDTIAGIIPIESMLKLTKRSLSQKLTYFSEKQDGLTPLATPVFITGASNKAYGNFKKLFSHMGMLTRRGGSGRVLVQKNGYKLYPGSAIGAQLVGGDLNITSIGTVTWVEKNKFLAFGHPFMNFGELEIPITSAHISMIMERKSLSFKLGYPLAKIGTLLQDRQSGIYGITDTHCDMIPVNINILNTITNAKRDFKIEVIRHHLLTRKLVNIATSSFIEAQEAIFGDHTCTFQTSIYLANRTLCYKNMYVGRTSLYGNFIEPLSQLYDNPFQKPNIKKIVIDIQIKNKLQKANIVSVKTKYVEFFPGQIITFYVTIQPHFEKAKVIKLKLKIPGNTQEGKHAITIIGGEIMKKAMYMPDNERIYIKNISIANAYKSNQIVIAMPTPSFKVLCHNTELKKLPSSIVANLLPTNSNKDIQIIRDSATITKDTNYFITGLFHLYIFVKKSEKEE